MGSTILHTCNLFIDFQALKVGFLVLLSHFNETSHSKNIDFSHSCMVLHSNSGPHHHFHMYWDKYNQPLFWRKLSLNVRFGSIFFYRCQVRQYWNWRAGGWKARNWMRGGGRELNDLESHNRNKKVKLCCYLLVLNLCAPRQWSTPRNKHWWKKV